MFSFFTQIKNHNSQHSSTAHQQTNTKTEAIKDMLQQIQIEFSRITEQPNNKSNNENDKQFKNNKIQVYHYILYNISGLYTKTLTS